MANFNFSLLWDIAARMNPLAELEAFLGQGGGVLTLIMMTTFALWMLILERFYYFWRVAPRDRQRVESAWRRRSDTSSWYARQVRRRLVSLLKARSECHLDTIKAVVSIAPLLGLMGTVTGMIDVFDAMAFAGSGNTRAMAAGVSKATIPTMAGMIVSLTGILCNLHLEKRLKANLAIVDARLPTGG